LTETRIRSGTVARTAVFTAFVAVTTTVFSVYIPATKGYFNIGEVMVYAAALLMGPRIGAFAGGVGSAISDSILAPLYAPGTLLIKGMEGFTVGYLANLPMKGLTRRRWLLVSCAIGLVVAVLVGYLGTAYLSGHKDIYLGFSYCSANCSTSSPVTVPFGPQFSTSFDVPSAVWVGIGLATLAAVIFTGYRLDERLGWTLVSILVGGSEMVLGYFIYESWALQLGYVSAATEVPVNIGQVLVGILVSVPLVRSYRRAMTRTSKDGRMR
jgi:uncharacterized membrane protein